jgi:hypothetical protein
MAAHQSPAAAERSGMPPEHAPAWAEAEPNPAVAAAASRVVAASTPAAGVAEQAAPPANAAVAEAAAPPANPAAAVAEPVAPAANPAAAVAVQRAQPLRPRDRRHVGVVPRGARVGAHPQTQTARRIPVTLSSCEAAMAAEPSDASVAGREVPAPHPPPERTRAVHHSRTLAAQGRSAWPFSRPSARAEPRPASRHRPVPPALCRQPNRAGRSIAPRAASISLRIRR